MGDDTTLIERARAAGAGKVTTRTAIASTGGLSVGALIFIYATFATKSDMERMRQTQTTQWQRIQQLQAEVNDLKAGNLSYVRLLDFVTTGRINAIIGNGRTN